MFSTYMISRNVPATNIRDPFLNMPKHNASLGICWSSRDAQSTAQSSWLLAGVCRAFVKNLPCGAELKDGTLLFTFGSAPTASSGTGEAGGNRTPPKAESSAQAASLPARDGDSKQDHPATASQAASAAQYAIIAEEEPPPETSAPAQPADVSSAAAAAGLAPASAAADATPDAALIRRLNDMTVRAID